MAIFDEDDSDAGSVFSSFSESSVESDEELAQEESNSSEWPSFKGINVMRSNDSEDEERIGLRTFTSNGSRVLSSAPSQRDLRDKDSSLGKRPPSTRPTLDSKIEQSGSFSTTAFALPAAATAYSATQDGYTTPARSQGVMRSIIPSQVSQSPIVHHVRASLPALLNGSPIRLKRSASFSNNPAQGAPVTIAAAQAPAHSGHTSRTAFAPTHLQNSPAPLHHNQTIPARLHHNQTPESLHYQTAAGYHNRYISQGNPNTNSSAPFHSVNRNSTTWSSTPSSSQAASSRLSSVPPYQLESHITEGGYDVVGDYLDKDSDPMRLAARKLIEEEDRTSCPEWRQLYLSVPLGSLPSVEDCNNLAPPLLKVLAIVPIREVLFKPESKTPAVQPVSKSKKSKKLAPVKAPTLRSNSSTLFCYKKVDDKYYCQLPRIVNEVEMACDHSPGVKHGTGVRCNHLLFQHPGVLDAINYFQSQQRTAIGLRQRSKRSNAMTDSTAPSWDETQQDAALHLLMRLVAVDGMSFSAATSKTFEALCHQLNPRFQFPCTDTLKDKLRKTVA